MATNLAQLKYDCSQNDQLCFCRLLTYNVNLSFASFSQAFALFSSSFATTKDWKIKLFPYPVGNTTRTSWFKSKLFTAVTCRSFSWSRTFAVAWNVFTTSEILVCGVDFQTACTVWLTNSCQILNFRWNFILYAISGVEMKILQWWRQALPSSPPPQSSRGHSPLAARAQNKSRARPK